MKIIIFFILVFFQSLAFAKVGVVIAFQTSLFKEANDESTILQMVRKGKTVYVPESVDLTKPLPEYIETFDRTGNIAYVKSREIKIVTNTELEKQWPISLGKNDRTDYRIEELIPPTYPFWDHEFGRASLQLTLGGNSYAPYNYYYGYSKQNYPLEKGGKLTLTKKASPDVTNRFYFGFLMGFSFVKNSLGTNDYRYSTESRTLFRVGPYFTYDAFRSAEFRLSTGFGITYNIHKTSIYLDDGHSRFEYAEERIFSGYSLSPLVSIGLEFDKIVPKMSFLVGTDVFFYLPHTQTAPDSSTFPDIWNGNQINSSARTQVSFFFGVQTKY